MLEKYGDGVPCWYCGKVFPKQEDGFCPNCHLCSIPFADISESEPRIDARGEEVVCESCGEMVLKDKGCMACAVQVIWDCLLMER